MFVTAAAVAMTALLAAPAADVKGKWEGTLIAVAEDGSKREDTALLILDQKGNSITGTIGGSETDQHPITSGSIDGDKVIIVAAVGGQDMRLELTLAGTEMKGTVSRGERRGQIQVKKRKG